MAGAADLRCAGASADRREALEGTASRVQRWLLVEQPGPWGRDALHESGLDPAVATHLAVAGRRAGVRVVLLRAAGWASSAPARHVFLVSTGPAGGWIERLDVDDPAELLALDLSVLARPYAPGVGRPGPQAIHMVCTNGRHDQCCAELGRPVVRALAEHGTPEVWECSHIGGDRFAANLVSLPTGVYFGRVPPERAAAMVDGLTAGLLDLDHYRGRSCYPPLVQAAEIFARRELGERRLAALRPLHAGLDRGDSVTVLLAAEGGRRVAVAVSRVPAAPARLTCSASSAAVPWAYRLHSLTTE